MSGASPEDDDTMPVAAADIVRMVWIGPPPGAYEELSLRSFLAQGARVIFYGDDRRVRLPDGVEWADAADFVSSPVRSFAFPDGDRSLALQSDLTRYALLDRLGGWYADLDVVALRPLPQAKVYLARETDEIVNGAVMKFPPHAPIMADALREAQQLVPAPGETSSEARLRIGPDLLTRLAHEHALDHLIRPQASAFEIAHGDIGALFDPARRDELIARTASSDFVHLWNEVWRRLRLPKNLGPPEGSYLDHLFETYGMGFPAHARMSARTVTGWLTDAHVLSDLRTRLGVHRLPRDAVERVLERTAVTVPPGRAAAGASDESRTVRMFWHGGPLGAYELLALKSFADRGCRVEVLGYDPSLDVPPWASRRDAAPIIAPERVLTYRPSEGRFAAATHLICYETLYKLGGWWVNPDVLLVGELPDAEFFMVNAVGGIALTALKLPREHPLLFHAIERVTRGEGKDTGAPLLAELAELHGISGFRRSGTEIGAVPWRDVGALFDPGRAAAVENLSRSALFFDLHGAVLRRAGLAGAFAPPKGSFLDEVLRRSGWPVAFAGTLELSDVHSRVDSFMGSLSPET